MAKNKQKVSNKSQIIDLLKSGIQDSFGVDAIMQMRDDNRKKFKTAFSYGWKNLDAISGLGGVPSGRILEVYGPESSGKTTLSLHMTKECQKKGGIVYFIDAENALDLEYAKALGVDTDDWLFSHPQHGEQAFSMMYDAILNMKNVEKDKSFEDSTPLFIVVDSVAALSPEKEVKGILDKKSGAGLGEHARMMSEGLRRLTNVMVDSNTTVLFINQTRSKIGVTYGSPETTTGGNSLKFYASVRIRISRTGSEKIGENIIGNIVKAKMVKNKLAPPFKECEGLIVFGEGFDENWDAWTLLKSKKLIVKKGAWSNIPSLPEIKSFSGYNSFKKVYYDNRDKIDKILRDYGEND